MSAAIRAVYEQYADEIRENSGRRGFGRRAIARKYGLSVWQARELLDWIAKGVPEKPDKPDKIPQVGSKKVEVEYHDNGHATATGSVKTLDELLDVAGVDRKKWNVASWQARTWDAAVGEGRVRTMHYVRAALERKRSAVVTPVVHHNIPEGGYPVSESVEELDTVMVIPDTQVGHRWMRRNGRESLVPMHDRRAMNVVWQVTERMKPATIVLLGDMLDMTELTIKYPRPMEVLGTAQPSILEMGWWLRDLRERCPESRIIYIEGNHEHRLQRMVTEKAKMLDNITGVNDDLPALSIARLLGLDALNIEYFGPFGADTWLWQHTSTPVRVHHGEIVRSKGGQTVAAQLQREQTSIIGGHIHRVECAWATDHGPWGRTTRIAMSPGCLCRVDPQLEGGVPGVGNRPDWQQGWGWLARDTKSHQLFGGTELVLNGTTLFRGERLEAPPEEELLADIRVATNMLDLQGA